MVKAREKAILAGLITGRSEEDIDSSMDELVLLADTAGADVIDRFTQKRPVADRNYYFGQGAAKQLAELVLLHSADMVIFNEELSPLQIRKLDELTEAKIIDRSSLILDIFARRALSREGKLQVKLAQLQYTLPRLIGLGNQLSRLGGGIGTRGPGETQLEVDRRVIRKKIGEMKKEIASLRKQRSLFRYRRKRDRYSLISLVGYTNAGKSTLLNALTGSDLYTEDKMFATLDPTVRKGILNNGKEVLYADTVGFIEKLPRQLVTAFQATFEEIEAADLLLLVVDSSNIECLKHISVVRDHLAKIDEHYYQKEIIVFNKIDLSDNREEMNYRKKEYPQAFFVSAIKEEGLSELKKGIANKLELQHSRLKLYLPYAEGKIYAMLKKDANILSVHYEPEHLEIDVVIDPAMAKRVMPFTRIMGADSLEESEDK